MNARKRRRGKEPRTSGSGDAESGDAESGDAESGAAFDPVSLEEDTENEGEHDAPRAAPAPRSPLPDDDIERLKSRAVTTQLPPTEHGHPDPAPPRKGG